MTASMSPEKPERARDGQTLWKRLYHGETRYDFVGKRRIGFAISGVLLLVTVISLFGRGLNLGLDFEGGVAWDVPAKGALTNDATKTILTDNGISAVDAKIQTVSSTDGTRLRVQVGDQSRDKQQIVRQAFADKAGVDVEEVALTSVSATWGSEITDKAVKALIVFFVVLFIYIWIRFEWMMSIGAIVAVVHDVLISVGVYALFQFPVTPATVIAFLTILGFSLYDTIVVFDKVSENAKRMGGGRYTYGDVVNLSMNQVLMRSINTSLAAVLPVLSLLIVGSLILGIVALQDFALALLVGLVTGSYSSIFIATPVLAIMKERFEPKYRQLREKLGQATGETAAARMAVAGATPAARVRATTASASGDEAAAANLVPAATALTHPPRPRKKRRH